MSLYVNYLSSERLKKFCLQRIPVQFISLHLESRGPGKIFIIQTKTIDFFSFSRKN